MWKRQSVWQFETPEGEQRLLVASRSSTWQVKLRHFSGLSRLYLQTASDLSNLRGRRVQTECFFILFNYKILSHCVTRLLAGTVSDNL